MLEDAPDIDTFVTPIGGGGLISGMATVARASGRDIEVIGVQAELFPSMYNRINGTNMACAGDTLAEGIAVKAPGQITGRMVEALVDDIVLVSERSLEEAVSLLLQIEKTVVEGAGSARSEEHTSELQSLMRISHTVLCLKKKKHINSRIISNQRRVSKKNKNT